VRVCGSLARSGTDGVCESVVPTACASAADGAHGKNAAKHLAPSGFIKSGARIVYPFLGRNEMGLGET
jgi:hypothetical protein